MKLRINKLAGMAALEARADAEYAALSAPEKAAYDMAVAAPRRPVAAKPVKKSGTSTAKSNFNRSVKQHFSAGRQLSAAHKKAISEGLKRWHAAHGRGSYTGRERRHAINHVNKHIAARAARHDKMHAVHKAKYAALNKKRNKASKWPTERDPGGYHRERARHHLKAANHLRRALLPLPGKK